MLSLLRRNFCWIGSKGTSDSICLRMAISRILFGVRRGRIWKGGCLLQLQQMRLNRRNNASYRRKGGSSRERKRRRLGRLNLDLTKRMTKRAWSTMKGYPCLTLETGSNRFLWARTDSKKQWRTTLALVPTQTAPNEMPACRSSEKNPVSNRCLITRRLLDLELTTLPSLTSKSSQRFPLLILWIARSKKKSSIRRNRWRISTRKWENISTLWARLGGLEILRELFMRLLKVGRSQ